MENSFSPYRFCCHEITAEQILCHCAFIITAVGGPKCFIDFVIKSAPRMARPDMCETRSAFDHEIDEALWAAYRRYDKSAVTQNLLRRYLMTAKAVRRKRIFHS